MTEAATSIFEIITPSDPLTLRAPDLKLAAGAVLLMGEGQVGAESLDGKEATPVLFGWEEWLKEREMWPLDDWLSAHTDELIVVLKSVALGSANERADYEAALEAIPTEEARQKFILARNDRRRSSMNDWEGRAHKLAKVLAGGLKC